MPVRSVPQFAQLARFGAVSVITTLLDFGLFNLLILSDTAPVLAANMVSYGAGVVASYALNKRLTFKGGRDNRNEEMALFVVLSLGGLVLNNVAVVVAAGLFHSPLVLNVAKLAAGAATWLLKFVAFDRWVYPSTFDDGSIV